MNKMKKVERQQLRSQVKRKATDDLTSRPSKIIRTELHKLADKLIIGSGDCHVCQTSSFWSIRLKRSLLTEHSSAVQNTFISCTQFTD